MHEAVRVQCEQYTDLGDNEIRRLLMRMVEVGDLVLAVLTLATWRLGGYSRVS